MRLFDFLRAKQNNNNQFLTEQAFKNNVAKQRSGVPLVIKQLHKINVREDKELKLEYFFYTDTVDKARLFAAEIAKLNYEVKYGQSAGDERSFVITGWTTKMKMQDNIIAAWAEKMCKLGYEFDCDFDGWGTSPDQ